MNEDKAAYVPVDQREAFLTVLADGQRHGIDDFPGHYRRRWSILGRLVREGQAIKHNGEIGESATVWTRP